MEQYKGQIFYDRVWVHFDIDMFYVACELLDRPELKDKPCAVGGIGMLSTANYVARKYGVRSAMPGFIGKELCPQLIILPCNFDKYKKFSHEFMRILLEFDPELESTGLDEANLDITQALQAAGIEAHQTEIVENYCERIRVRLNEELKLTSSCGIGPNKMIAKLASEKRKPNGLYAVRNTPESVDEFIAQLPVRKIPGIGNVMEQLLRGLGVDTCQNVRDRADELKVVFSEKTFQFLLSSACGYSRNYHIEGEDSLSVSCQRTFTASSDLNSIEDYIVELSARVAEDLDVQAKLGLQVVLTLKSQKFEVRCKSMQMDQYTKNAEVIANYSKKILSSLLPIDQIRLVGVRVTQLQDESTYKKNSIQSFLFQKCQASKSKIQEESSIKSLVEPQNSSNQLFGQKSNFINSKSICPICNETVDSQGNIVRMNRHIDQCLGGQQQKEQQKELQQYQFGQIKTKKNKMN